MHQPKIKPPEAPEQQVAFYVVTPLFRKYKRVVKHMMDIG